MSPSDALNIKEWLKEKKHKQGYFGEKLDSNGYSVSLFSGNRDGECYLCGRRTDTARHEIYGAADRDTSKAVGMWVCLCLVCHSRVHGDADELHKAGQRVFEYYHSHDEFMALFGRNYL